MTTRLPIFTASLMTAVIFASIEQKSFAATPAVDPAHAAHVASGAMPPDASTGDPALLQKITELQTKVSQLQTSLAASNPPAVTPPMAMGMIKMKPAGMSGMNTDAAPAPPMAGMSAPPAPTAGGMGMMGMMDKMMGMMDKMMGMGGGAMPPSTPTPGMGMMDMDMKMPPMGGGSMPSTPAAPMSGGMGMMNMDNNKGCCEG